MFARAALTKYHRLEGIYCLTVLETRSQDQSMDRLLSPEAFLLGFQIIVPLLPLRMIAILCIHTSSVSLHVLNFSYKDTNPNCSGPTIMVS